MRSRRPVYRLDALPLVQRRLGGHGWALQHSGNSHIGGPAQGSKDTEATLLAATMRQRRIYTPSAERCCGSEFVHDQDLHVDQNLPNPDHGVDPKAIQGFQVSRARQ